MRPMSACLLNSGVLSVRTREPPILSWTYFPVYLPMKPSAVIFRGLTMLTPLSARPSGAVICAV